LSRSSEIPNLSWRDRFTAFRATLILFAIAVVISLPALTGSGRDLNYLENFWRFAGKFFPPDLSVTQNIAPRWMNLVTRMILNIIRTLPSLIWALLAVAVVGPNPLAGVIGLTFYSIGYLGKFFSDAFESLDTEVSDGLRASGANAIQSFQYGLLPQVKPLILSHVLWMLEYNIRSAAIIGYVGAGGIGLLLHTYQEFGHWDRFSTVLIFILVLVTTLDFFGEWLRGKILRDD
jgi:phosphonate transport system permease protein